MRAISKYKPPEGLIFGGGDITEGFLGYEFGGLIFGAILILGSCLVVSRIHSNDPGVPGLPFRGFL